MVILCSGCGQWYLSEGKTCPKCGHTLTMAEADAYAREKVATKRSETKEEKQKRLQRQWGTPSEVAARVAADKRAVSAVLISTTNKRSAVGTIARATVGGAIFGLAGAIGGAASAKSHTTHATFSVKYASGRTGTETVEINSKRFKELSALLHG